MATASKPTQDFVPVEEIRDGLVMLKDGSLRAIVLASSINFALKSAEEQQAIIYQFQDFLNSIDFPVQIFIESRRLDIRPYLSILEKRYKEVPGDLLKIQTREYIEFIRKFTDNTNIMTKSFFIVVPYSPAIVSTKNAFGNIFGNKTAQTKKKEKNEVFEENRAQLEQRIGIVEQGLVRCGVRIVPLGTEEVIELFYKIFNPSESDKPIHL